MSQCRDTVQIFRKISRKLHHFGGEGLFVIFLPVLLVVVAVVRLMAPVWRIRMKVIFSNRLGHFSSEPDFYLARKLAEGAPKKTLDIFGLNAQGVCNRQLAKMWSRKMLFMPFLRHVYRVNKLFPGWQHQEIPWDDLHNQDGIVIPDYSFLEFTDEERKKGEALLKEIIGPITKPIVCVFNRDSEYLNRAHQYRNWAYHDYRDSKIDNYLPAMEWLAEHGYIVMRMGAVVAQPIGKVSESIVDYAKHHRSDFMDIYLFDKCDFIVGAVTGLTSLGAAFRKPAAHVNAAPFLTVNIETSNKDELFVPKLYFSECENRILSIKEIISLGLENIGSTKTFEQKSIRLIENEAEDILAITREIEGLMTGQRPLNDQEIQIQRAFWEAVGIDLDTAEHFPQPSPSFLLKHEQVLFSKQTSLPLF